MSIRESVLKWTISRCDPLVPDAYRLAASDELHRVSAAEPAWFRTWAAGVLSDLIETLDPEDPWRLLEERDGVIVKPDGSPFGTWRDAEDLLPSPPEGNPELDIGLAALAIPLSGPSIRLWMGALRGRLAAEEQLSTIAVGGSYPVAAPAIERAMFRRRLFIGMEDAYIPHACNAWTARAEKIVNAEPWDESGAARLRAGSRVEPGSWRLLA